MKDLESTKSVDICEFRKAGRQSREDCLSAVRKDGLALQYVIWQTPEICAHAVRQNPDALAFVRDESLRERLAKGIEPYLLDLEENRIDVEWKGLDGVEFILTPFFRKVVLEMRPIARYYESYFGRPISYDRVEFEFEEGCRRFEYVKEYNPDLPMARETRPWRHGWVMSSDYNYDVIEFDEGDDEEIMRIPAKYYHNFLHALWEVLCGYKKLKGVDEDFWRSLPEKCVEHFADRFMSVQ